MMIRSIAVLSVGVISLPGCEEINLCEPTALTVSPVAVAGNPLRLDGFYYERPDRSAVNPAVEYFVLYEDGIMLYAFREYVDELDEEFATLTSNGSSYGADCQHCWGAFSISGSELILEQWTEAVCSEPVYRRKGRILNDSTFVFTSYVISESGAESAPVSISDTFSFQQAVDRPDPVNQMVR